MAEFFTAIFKYIYIYIYIRIYKVYFLPDGLCISRVGVVGLRFGLQL